MNIFYNPTQRRMRAAWRLLLLGILFFIPALLVTLVVPPFLSTLLSGKALPLLSVINGGLLLAFTLFDCWLAARFFDHRSFRDFGFHFEQTWWRDLVFGLALGAVLMFGIFLIEWAASWITVRSGLAVSVRGITLPGALIIGAISYVCVGITEELFFRGYLMRNLAEGLLWRFINPRAALLLAYLLSSLIFGLLHQDRANASPLTSPILALTGMLLGLGYLLTGELAMPIGLHITWNFFQGYVFGFPVSGSGHGAALIAIKQGGPTPWTGGAWGPEGGFVGLLALLVGSLAILAWVRLTRGAIRPLERLAIYEPPVHLPRPHTESPALLVGETQP